MQRPDGSDFTSEQVEEWFPGGRYPTDEQYEAMPAADRSAFDSAMRDLIEDPPRTSRERLFDLGDWDATYENMFSEYFEKGDGDGN